MDAKSKFFPWLAAFAGLLIPGMGQFLLGRRLRGLMFFLLANIIFISALLVIAARFYRAVQVIPATSQRWPMVMEQMAQQGWGILPVLGILYLLLLLGAALDAFFLARRRAAANFQL